MAVYLFSDKLRASNHINLNILTASRAVILFIYFFCIESPDVWVT